MENSNFPNENNLDAVAIIGMAGRFPKAENINQFWNNLVTGTECIDTFSSESQSQFNLSSEILNSNKYVPRGGRISEPDMFDAAYFGYTPKEASLIDPQHRIFLQCGVHALEDAGYNISKLNFSVGVFAGCGMNHYFIQNILASSALQANEIQLILGNDKDFLTTRLSYKLNLKGPSFDIQTACSSSLVAVHIAFQNLLTYQCDMALAGGVFLQIPWWNGYLITDGDIRSPEGICRPFDSKANGTVFGEGVGIVVLKRLQDAIKDHDHIYALIRGSAVNNDGSGKAGYTAPSIDGQSEVIATAIESSGINPTQISYIETHGTGTPIGDPIEIAALSKVFRKYTNKKMYCPIGALKASIGHLDAAAGIAGLIKTALSLYHEQIPATVNFQSPNPLLKLEESPFFVNNANISWSRKPGNPRFAGVSSLGVGGTNAHVILEEAPEISSSETKRKFHFLPFSTKTNETLETASDNLSKFLSENKESSLADCAFTFQNGRQHLKYRGFQILESDNNNNHIPVCQSQPVTIPNDLSRKIVFMFSGQGTQYINMGGDLYQSEPVFKNAFDACSDLVKQFTDTDLCELLYLSTGSSNTSDILSQTAITQPLLFSFEYSLTKLWESFNIKPDVMIGHSIGEYVAACVAGVFSLKDALFLVCERGRLMQNQPGGVMCSVNLPEVDLIPLLDSQIEIAVCNAPNICVTAGNFESMDKFIKKLEQNNIKFTRLNTSHAFHSYMMNDVLEQFIPLFDKISISKPKIPFISNVTADYFDKTDITNRSFWGHHLRQKVRFSDGITTLLKDGYRTFIEIGPGNALTSFVNTTYSYWSKNQTKIENILTFTSVRHKKQLQNDNVFFLNSLGKLWQYGFEIDFSNFYKMETRHKISMPLYPFQKNRYWIQPDSKINSAIGLPSKPVIEQISTQKQTTENQSHSIVPSNGPVDLFTTISSIWKDLLGLTVTDPNVNFFEIGGDSIWASQILSRIRDKTGMEIPLKILYTTPTLKEFVSEIEQFSKKNTNETKYSGPVKLNQNSGLPLSSSQLRLWFLYKLNPESPAYNLSTQFELIGPMNKECVFRALDAIVERHDAFRTTFDEGKNGPSLRINTRLNFKFETLDLSSYGNDNNIWINEIRSRSVKPYNLTTGPLLRILLICLSENHHILSVMTHHIVSDGWSMGVFLRDFSQYYQSFLNSTVPNLPSLQFRFADYAKWQNDNQSNVNNSSLEFWSKTLLQPLPVLQLPSFKNRPSILTNDGGSVSFTLSKELSSEIEAFSKRQKTTLFTVLLGVFYSVLNRYSGQSDIIIGTPVANRHLTELENLIGFFLNMIPIRVTSNEHQSFSKLLEEIKSITSDAFSHSAVPFSKLIEIINPPRDINYHPVYQVMFAFQNFPIESVKINSTTIKPFLVDRGASEYDISLYMWMEQNVLTGFFEYSTDILDKQYVQSIVEHFMHFCQLLIKNPDQSFTKLDILPPSEYDKIVRKWNNTATPFPNNKCIFDLFEEQVAKTPASPAVLSINGNYTYKELNDRADKIASNLIKKGASAGDIIGIYMNRSRDTVAALLAILKSGAAYVPLDPSYPEDRLAYMIQDSGSNLILTTSDMAVNIKSLCGDSKILCIDTDINFDSDINLERPKSISADSIAYIIYTSGSTGKPKGVRISHRSAVNFLSSMAKKPGINASDVVLATTTISFDISVLEIFLPLVNGSSTVIIEREITYNTQNLISVIGKFNPTIMQATPSMWRMLLNAGWNGSPNIKALCGGEALTGDLVKELLPKVKELWNMYGPTETTVWATVNQITSTNQSILIGMPISNMSAYILDPALKPVPVGATGTLYLGGVGLADGYHNKPDITSQKFIKNPFAPGLIYNTGDNARYHIDGNIEYLGRSDYQVKLRGHRIELGEIESVALTHQNIDQCAVICKELSSIDKRLVLFYTVKPGVILNSADLKQHLQSAIPEYMIPQHFVQLESMPLSPTGKINRNALPFEPKAIQIESIHKQEPESDEEIYIANIWKKVLGINQVTLHDNFFELGGHSLLSISVLTQIKNETGCDIHPRLMMLNTLEQVASHISLKKSHVLSNAKKKQSFVKVISSIFRIKV